MAKSKGPPNFPFAHGTNAEKVLANSKQYYIEFYHVPSKKSVKFKAYLTNFTDKFASDWNSEEVYGRMDPIVGFKGTKRNITLEWELPASSVAEAEENLQKCSLLFNMLYPKYNSSAPGAVVSAPPLFRVRFANLIHDGSTPQTGGVASAESSGIVCNIDGFQYSPEMDDGFFEPAKGIVYPQAIALSCEMTVLHTHSLGWAEGGTHRTGGENFPYGLKGSSTGGADTTQDPAPTRQAATPQQATAQGNGVTGGGSN